MLRELLTIQILGQEVTLYYFGMFMIFSVFVGIVFLYLELRLRKLKRTRLFYNFFWILLFGILGGRLTFVISHFSYYFKNPAEAFLYWYGGFYLEGSLVFALAYIFFWLYRKKRKEFFSWLDSIFLSFLAGNIVAKLGKTVLEINQSLPSDFSITKIFLVSKFTVLGRPVLLQEVLLSFCILVVLKVMFHFYHDKLFNGVYFFFGICLFEITRFVLAFAINEDVIFSAIDLDFNRVHLLSFLILTLSLFGLLIKYREENK